MYNGKAILGLITARGGSKGLPSKNIKPLLGKPLIAWTIEQALASKYLDRVIVSTDDKEIYDLLKMIRSHGWDRELDADKQNELRTEYNINDFDALYIFYVPGFNIRPTDLNSYIGIKQIDRLDKNNQIRFENFKLYESKIKNDFWKIQDRGDFISSFAYPIIHPNRNKIAKALLENQVECRPLISGSLANHPIFMNLNMEDWLKESMKNDLKFANQVHEIGMYIPNNPLLTKKEIEFIIDIVNLEIS